MMEKLGVISGYKKYLTDILSGYKKYLKDMLSGYKKYKKFELSPQNNPSDLSRVVFQ